jgi:hypothetical protein
MPTDMASQYSKSNSKGRLHMPKVYSTKIHQLKKAVARTAAFLVTVSIKIGISIFSAWLVSLWALPAAYAQRGYFAVGGEWILIIAAFGATYWAITVQFRKLKSKGGVKYIDKMQYMR